jgi:hypothetical protein
MPFPERELRLVEMDIADLQDRYSVTTTTELAVRIEDGEIHSHPAWEDLIEWQNLDAYKARLVHARLARVSNLHPRLTRARSVVREE